MLNKSSNEILCEDCKLNYVTQSTMDKYGKCLSCHRREVIARTKGIKYVKYVDLSDKEKQRIQKQRKTNNAWAQKRYAKAQDKVIENSNVVRKNQIYTQEILQCIKENASNTRSVKELRGIIQGLFPSANITVANFNNVISRHNIPHSVRTDYSRHHKTEDTLGSSEIISTISTVDSNKGDNTNAQNGIIEDVANTEVIAGKPETVKLKNIATDEDGDPVRFKPIKDEVVSVLGERFKQDNCDNELNYLVSDYINLLEMFEYLTTKIDTILMQRNKQLGIINSYQTDVIHEMENEIADDGDTYLQDKMHIIRDYRRYMEVDILALSKLRPILKLIKGAIHPSNPNNLTDLKSINGCLSELKAILRANTQPKFAPRVDVGMAQKYDWAVMKNSVNKREVKANGDILKPTTSIANPVRVVSNKAVATPANSPIVMSARSNRNYCRLSLTPDEEKNGFAIYRVSCKISGGKYGVFSSWYKDYKATRQEMAIAWAQQEFARMKSANGQILVTDIDCHQIN